MRAVPNDVVPAAGATGGLALGWVAGGARGLEALPGLTAAGAGELTSPSLTMFSSSLQTCQLIAQYCCRQTPLQADF